MQSIEFIGRRPNCGNKLASSRPFGGIENEATVAKVDQPPVRTCCRAGKGGISQVNFHLRRASITNPLLAGDRPHFSQNDEDGILLEILRRIEITQPLAFLEFGVGDGTENNTIILLALGWRGVWVGGQSLSFQVPIDSNRLVFLQRWITRDNAAE
jgi:hypothetical protein